MTLKRPCCRVGSMIYFDTRMDCRYLFVTLSLVFSSVSLSLSLSLFVRPSCTIPSNHLNMLEHSQLIVASWNQIQVLETFCIHAEIHFHTKSVHRITFMQFVCTYRIEHLAHKLRCTYNICMRVQLQSFYEWFWKSHNHVRIFEHIMANSHQKPCLSPYCLFCLLVQAMRVSSIAQVFEWSRTCYQCSRLPCKVCVYVCSWTVNTISTHDIFAVCVSSFLKSASQGKAAVQAERRRKEELEEDLIALQNEAKAIHDDPRWHVFMAFLPCSPPSIRNPPVSRATVSSDGVPTFKFAWTLN